jgi:Tfp pilus assembly protein PilF
VAREVTDNRHALSGMPQHQEDSMYRADRFAQQNHISRTSPVMAAVALSALLIAGACTSGGEDKPKVDGTAVPTVSAPAVPAGEPETSAGDVGAPRAASPAVTFASARTAYTHRDYAGAQESFGAYVEQHPDDAFGYYMLGLSAWKNGDLDGAKDALQQSLALDSTKVKTLLNLGRVLLEQGHADEAMTRIASAVALDSGSAEVYRMQARVQNALGQRDSAEASYRLALSLDPTDSWSMNNLGLLLIESGRYEDALVPLARAVELRPDAPVFENNLGAALERTGHAGSAAAAYRAALAADSSYAKAKTSLARVEGKSDETPVDIAALAGQFAESLQTAAQLRVSAKPAVVKPER